MPPPDSWTHNINQSDVERTAALPKPSAALLRAESRRNKQTPREREATLTGILLHGFYGTSCGIDRQYLCRYLWEGPEIGMSVAEWERRKTWIIKRWLRLTSF